MCRKYCSRDVEGGGHSSVPKVLVIRCTPTCTRPLSCIHVAEATLPLQRDLHIVGWTGVFRCLCRMSKPSSR